MSDSANEQESGQPVGGPTRHFGGKQNGARGQFHKGCGSGPARAQGQKHYATARPYQGKGHGKGARGQRAEYGSLQNLPPYMQYYPSPVANGFAAPAPGGFYGYSPTPYYPPATMGYETAVPSAMLNPKYKMSQESSESSTPSSATTTPVAKKIEITNKSGDHVDLNAIHLAQHATETTPMTTAGATVSTFNEGPVPTGEEKKTDENTKKAQLDFLAEVKRRKEMLAKKKAVDDADETIEDDALDRAKSTAGDKSSQNQSPPDSEPREVSTPVGEPHEEAQTSVGSEQDETTEEVEQSAAPSVVEEEQPAVEAVKTEEPEAVEAPSVAQSDNEVSLEKPETADAAAESQPIESSASAAAASSTSDATLAPAPEKEQPVLTFAEKLKLKKAKEAPASAASEAAPASNADEVTNELVDTESKTEAAVTEEDHLGTMDVTAEAEQSKLIDEPEMKADDATFTAEEKSTPEPATVTAGEEKSQEPEDTEEADDDRMTISELLEKLEKLPAVEDIYTFKYPEGVQPPSDRFKKTTVKYTYPPEFLLQFGDKVNVKLDDAWKESVFKKIVFPPGSVKSSRGKGGDKFSGSNFKKSGSMRLGDRSNSKSMSKRSKSKRMADDGKNRSYTSRKEREAKQEADDKDVAPLVPSANRWIPKSKLKKTEKKLAPDGVTELLDKEEAERKMKSLLNKLTLEKFDPISEEIIKIADQSKWEENGESLKVVIEQIFDKATDEPHWSSMYAQLCGKVVKDLDKDIQDKENEGKVGPILVLHYLFDRCQTEFQKGWADKLPTSEDGSTVEVKLMSDEYYKAAAAKRRGLGLVRLIGFLYRSNLLTSKMMFQCFRRLMKDLTGTPSEETLESVIELLTTVGEQFERDSLTTPNGSTLEGSALLDQLFFMLDQVMEDCDISSRIRFSLLDLKDMRNASWNGGKKDEGPKTIAQIHEEEAAKKAVEERERRMRGSSRSASRRQNNSMGGRSGSRKDIPPPSKDDFITMRSASSKFSQQQKHQKEEAAAPQASSNMFSALMGHDDEDDEEDDE
ncbi:AaceriAGL044Cp [[Ashbya] aceris (nom. inval.)]|nr:AaceriAGL044Cp [[Ashbya] aceris (nom. inval.)]